eukprot:CAMPEP_0180352340 /NCGR_PEP_ID=MMETSP0989-20121125/7022_1 /TAXON_ID=697907 /ORGANISM="non described non described, Strain CCMP2293" /LENGTH=688 /DNA_ID=CAMNT_0022341867 /DNA_START=322 /DNA_END=2389 /DNA_ORIENTATION=-
MPLGADDVEGTDGSPENGTGLRDAAAASAPVSPLVGDDSDRAAWPEVVRVSFTAPAADAAQQLEQYRRFSSRQQSAAAARTGYAASDPGEAREIEPFAPSAAEESPSAPFASPDAENRRTTRGSLDARERGERQWDRFSDVSEARAACAPAEPACPPVLAVTGAGMGAVRPSDAHEKPVSGAEYGKGFRVSATLRPEEHRLVFSCAMWLLSLFASCAGGADIKAFTKDLQALCSDLFLFASGFYTNHQRSSVPGAGTVLAFPPCAGVCSDGGKREFSCIRCLRGAGRELTPRALQQTLLRRTCFKKLTAGTFTDLTSVLASGLPFVFLPGFRAYLLPNGGWDRHRFTLFLRNARIPGVMSSSLLHVLQNWSAVARGCDVAADILTDDQSLLVAAATLLTMPGLFSPVRSDPAACHRFLSSIGFLLIPLTPPEVTILDRVSAPLRALAAVPGALMKRFSTAHCNFWRGRRVQNLREGSMGNKPGRYLRNVRVTEEANAVITLLVLTIIAAVLGVPFGTLSLIHLIELASRRTRSTDAGFFSLMVQGFHRDYPGSLLDEGLHLSFNLPFGTGRDVWLFPRSHLSASGDITRHPIRLHVPANYLLVWNPILFHAGGAGSAVVSVPETWMLAYHGLVTTGGDPLKGANPDTAAQLWPADVPPALWTLYNGAASFPSRDPDPEEIFHVVRGSA